MMADNIFQENQKFKWAIILSLILISTILPYIINKNSIGIWLSLIIIVGVIALLSSIKMQIRIDQNKLMFRYIPFINSWRKLPFKEIQEMKLIKYSYLREFEGWGIRYNFDYWLYNTGGRYGILVKTGKKKFIRGTYKLEEAEKAISHRNFKEPDHDAC